MRTVVFEICIALAALAGFGVGYLLWDRTDAYYAVDLAVLGPGPENDLIRYGHALIVDTPRYVGRSAENPAMAYGGNDLACQSCHLKAGLQPFAAPFVSTAATFPMMVNNKVVTLPDRINSCMALGLNGRPLPEDSQEMAALIAYIEFVGKGTPEGIRLPGMGLMPIALPEALPDSRRGLAVYAQHCASCHGQNGQGEAEAAAERRLLRAAALGRRQLQWRRGHGAALLCGVLYPRQHADRRRLPDAHAHGSGGLGRRGLHDFQSASDRPAGAGT